MDISLHLFAGLCIPKKISKIDFPDDMKDRW